jgi:hypothetical protein
MTENETTTLSQNVRHQSRSDAEPYSRRLKFLILLPPVKLAKVKEKRVGGVKKGIFKCQVIVCHHMVLLKEILHCFVG